MVTTVIRVAFGSAESTRFHYRTRCPQYARRSAFFDSVIPTHHAVVKHDGCPHVVRVLIFFGKILEQYARSGRRASTVVYTSSS
jgi:hypothetical protein